MTGKEPVNDGFENYDRVIVHAADEKTTDEQCLEMLHHLEKTCNTGPLIGEGRGVILHLCRNLMARDIILDTVVGMGLEDREKYYLIVEELMDEKDSKLIEKRNAKTV